MFTLKNHPFAVEAFFESSLVLTYAVPKEELKSLIPECLELDTFNNALAFVAVAVVNTKHLRPKGFPRFTGSDFILTGYRIFVKYTTRKGKHLRGLYILKSETNKKSMAFFGNIFTHYNYTVTDIVFKKSANTFSVYSGKSGLDIEVSLNKPEIKLPISSPFADWKEARRFAGPLPFTFTYNPLNREVLIIEGVRQNWTPKPVEILNQSVGFIKQKNLKGLVLANAFLIENIPYYWKKGVKEIWKG